MKYYIVGLLIDVPELQRPPGVQEPVGVHHFWCGPFFNFDIVIASACIMYSNQVLLIGPYAYIGQYTPSTSTL